MASFLSFISSSSSFPCDEDNSGQVLILWLRDSGSERATGNSRYDRSGRAVGQTRYDNTEFWTKIPGDATKQTFDTYELKEEWLL